MVLFSFIAGLYLPWWSIALVTFVVALFIPQPAGFSFLTGFAGIFIHWSLLALWIDRQNESILSHKIAELFSLNGSSSLLILVTALTGGVVGGFAAMSGSLLLPRKKHSTGKYVKQENETVKNEPSKA
jgi:hypothetical protein